MFILGVLPARAGVILSFDDVYLGYMRITRESGGDPSNRYRICSRNQYYPRERG